jgi:hypothetical protein
MEVLKRPALKNGFGAKTRNEHCVDRLPHFVSAVTFMSSSFSYQLVNSLVRGITNFLGHDLIEQTLFRL